MRIVEEKVDTIIIEEVEKRTTENAKQIKIIIVKTTDLREEVKKNTEKLSQIQKKMKEHENRIEDLTNEGNREILVREIA